LIRLSSTAAHNQSPLFYWNNPVRGEIIRRIKRKPRKDILRCLGVKGVARRRGRRRFEILIERDNRLPGRGFVCLCLLLFWFFFTLIVCVYCTNTHKRIKSKKDKKTEKRFWLPMSAYGAVINEGIRLLTQRRVKREPASCTQPVQPCCFISFLSLQKRREETGGIFSTGNVWQRRQDTL
jgi:hypothetical protein